MALQEFAKHSAVGVMAGIHILLYLQLHWLRLPGVYCVPGPTLNALGQALIFTSSRCIYLFGTEVYRKMACLGSQLIRGRAGV